MDTTDARFRKWHLRLRKKHDALREEAAAIERMKDPVQQDKAWRRYMKRSLAVTYEGTDFVRALTDHALGWQSKPTQGQQQTHRKALVS